MLKAGRNYPGVSVGGLILSEDGRQVLLIYRTQQSKYDPNKWTQVVGEVNFRESMVAALKREVREETGLRVEVIEPIRVVEIIKGNVHWVGQDFLCRRIGGRLKNREPETHGKLGWFPFDKLPAPIGRETQATIKAYLLSRCRITPR
jgi:ADP-ribose pyrophosphatase YjhB (NUDIX family)